MLPATVYYSQKRLHLTEAQLSGIKTPTPLFVTGGAGTGKTALALLKLQEMYLHAVSLIQNTREEAPISLLFSTQNKRLLREVKQDRLAAIQHRQSF